MQPVCVLKKYGNLVSAYSPDLVSPNAAHAACIYHATLGTGILNVGAYSMNVLGHPPTGTWDEFLSGITSSAILEAYLRTDMAAPRFKTIEDASGRRKLVDSEFGMPRVYPKQLILSSAKYLQLSYGHPDHYGTENDSAQKNILIDLVVRPTNPAVMPIDLSNTLAIVNGCAVYSEYVTDNSDPRLYIKNAACLLKGMRKLDPEIVLLDFSPIGTLEQFESFGSFGYITRYNRGLQCYVPSTWRGKFVGMAAFGGIFIGNNTTGSSTLRAECSEEQFASLQLAYQHARHSMAFNGNSLRPTVQDSETYEWAPNLNTDQHHAFVFAIDRSDVCMSVTPSLGKLGNMLRFPAGSNGLLFNSQTLRHHVHFQEEYASATHVTFAPTNLHHMSTVQPMHMTSTEHVGQVGMIGKPGWCDAATSFDDGPFHMLEIFAPA